MAKIKRPSIAAGQLYFSLILFVPWVFLLLVAFYERAYAHEPLPADLFLRIYLPLEILRITICANIFGVRLIPSKFGLDLQSLIIATPFLIAGIFFTFRLVGNVVTAPDPVSVEASNRVLYFRTLARWSIVILLIIASFISRRDKISLRATAAVSGSAVAVSLILALGVIWFGNNLPLLFTEEAGATLFSQRLGYAAILLSFFGAYRYGRIAIKERDFSYFYIAAALGSGLPTEYAFLSVYAEDDIFRLTGNVFGALGFVLAFMGIANKSIIRPYERVLHSENNLMEANRELEAFNYSVSHDLRTPLRTITGFSNILLEDYSDKLDAVGRNYLARMVDSTGKMNKLIDDILNLSRITRREVKRIDLNLSELAESIVAGLRTSQPGRKVEITIQKGVRAIADPNLMEILLGNLLGNAWKFTAQTPYAKIEFGRTRSDFEPVYYVKDNGAGFDPQFKNKLFLPFQRLHTAEEFEGTGIGLALVDRIVRKHGGRIWAQSEIGHGAAFYFTLGQDMLL